MSAMDGMVKTLLKGFGVDPEEVKGEVTKRIAAFEQNINVLNSTLVCILETQKRIERNQHRIAAMLSIPDLEPIPTANGAAAHDNITGSPLLTAV